MTDGPYFPLVVNRRRAADDRRHGDRRKDGTHPALDLPMPARLADAASYDELLNALRVIVFSPRTNAWLQANDPQALAQADRALHAAHGRKVSA